MELEVIKQQTTWNDAAGSINSNFAKIRQAIVALQSEGTGFDEQQLAAYLVENGYITDTQLAQRLASYASKSDLEALSKTLTDFLSGSDTDTIINKWKELETFLGGLSESDNLATILSTKADSKELDDVSDRVTEIENSDYATKSYVDTENRKQPYFTVLGGDVDKTIQMHDHAGNNQYPVTLASIVYDDNGKSVSDRLAALEVLLEWFEWGDTEHKSVKAKYHLWSVGQVSASGKGEEGEGGGGAGMMLLTEWDDSITDLSSYALGANLGKGLRDEIAAMKANPSSFITLKTINNQSLFGSGNIDVKTTVEWSDIAGRPTNLSEFTNDKGYITEVTERMIVDATEAIPNSGKVLISTGGTLNWLPYPRNLSDLTDDVVAGHYLPLTGGTMNAGAGIRWAAQAEKAAYVGHYTNDGSLLISIEGTATDKGLVLGGTSGNLLWKGKRVWDAGNFSPADYLPLNGSNAMTGPLKLQYAGDISIVSTVGMFVGRSNKAGGAAFDYASFINIPDGGLSQLQLSWYRAFNNFKLTTRVYESNTWSDWKTIAFTDSDITGNAATATDADMLDGYHASAFAKVGIANNLIHNTNEFTFVSAGYTGDVWLNYRTASMLLDGNITGYVFGDGKGGHLAKIKADTISFGDREVLSSKTNALYVGQETATYNSLPTYVWGNGVSLIGANGYPQFILNSSGNVTIGSSDLAGTGAKLYVNGAINTTDNINIYGGYLSLRPATNVFGDIEMTSSRMRFQALHDGVAYLPISLNPNGGNVGIGTTNPAYKLDVAGTGRFAGLASFDAGVKIGTTTLGNTNLGLSINTSFYPSSVGLSLGHSSYRWHNVFANNVHTDEVKIGDATLTWDGIALKVDKPFYSISQVSAGAKAVEAQAVIAPLELTSKPTASTTTEYTDAEIASQFGLTSDVLANLARGIYTRVTYKSIIESLVWSYEVYYVGESKTIIFRNGTGSTYNSRNYKFERDSTTGKWKITNA